MIETKEIKFISFIQEIKDGLTFNCLWIINYKIYSKLIQKMSAKKI